MKLRSAARTHPGLVRSRNEDSMLERADIGLWAVADGMGGHSRGDWASAQVVRFLAAVDPPASAQHFLQDVRGAILAAHAGITAMAAESGSEALIGCTVVAVMAFDRFYACLWAGDSRLYRLRRGNLERLSRDHSRVQEMIDAGLLAEADAKTHPQANIITRAVGIGELELEAKSAPLEAGDVLLLCTDGLDKMMSDEEIVGCLAGNPPAVAAEKLIAGALGRGGRDNVTVIVVECGAADDDDTLRLSLALSGEGNAP